MSETFDPRENLRTIISTLKAINPDDWEEQKVITFTYDSTDYMIPIFLSEESSSLEEPPFPFIDINLGKCTYDPHDVGATTRRMEAYMDVGFYFTASDDIVPSTFGKAVLDELQDNIRSNQETCGFAADFLSIRNIRLLREGSGRQVVYHYVIEIYAIFYD